MLEAQICDVWGDPIAGGTIYRTAEGGGLEVTDPLNDARTARLTLSIYDKAAHYCRPLDRLLSVTYGPHLIFKGPILQVATDYASASVQITAHDASIKLKQHFHRYGDAACDTKFPIDGRGVRLLVESSLPTATQIINDVPPNGILWGHDTTTHEAAAPPAGDGIWRGPVKPGTNVWESINNLKDVLPGRFDFRLTPVDKDHLGVLETSIPGFYCELDTADRLGTDKSDTLILEHGLGQDTAENVTHEPDGDVVRNYFTQVYPGGQKGRNDHERRATAKAPNSIADYGLLEGWESSGQTNDTQAVLLEKARSMVKAYARPPDFFTVAPRQSSADVPRYPGDMKVGDTIRVRARKGTRQVDLIGRILSATVAAIDQAGNSRVTLECAPDLDVTLDT